MLLYCNLQHDGAISLMFDCAGLPINMYSSCSGSSHSRVIFPTRTFRLISAAKSLTRLGLGRQLSLSSGHRLN